MKIRPKLESRVMIVLEKLNSKTFGSDTQPEKKISFSKVLTLLSIQMNQLLLLVSQDVVKVLL